MESHESLYMVSIETKITIIILLKNINGRDFKHKIARINNSVGFNILYNNFVSIVKSAWKAVMTQDR